MVNPLLLDSLLLGVQHSFEPDHMAAVSVLASEKDKKNRAQIWRIVWRSSHWALGHSFTLILFACLILLLKSSLSLNIAEQVELVVGPLMIWLGLVAIRRNFVPAASSTDTSPKTVSRSFWVGMIHGLAGTGGACTIALTLAARDASTAVWIIILQSVGIVVAMTVYGCLLAFSLHKVIGKWQTAIRMINYVVGGFSILIGFYTLYEVLLS
ncbi:cytochrome c biogenesis protein CcdA [Tellurirhabdus bombi]|uniref:cytochrome c biogenesis protein CcdA n=1 Tax=Tellurirhabdus bombi TaxID=2907205 RepID=UPI001F370A05|nr:cytochrome c biogenesis protein CcdA [Tellurirhabdus bombi]